MQQEDMYSLSTIDISINQLLPQSTDFFLNQPTSSSINRLLPQSTDFFLNHKLRCDIKMAPTLQLKRKAMSDTQNLKRQRCADDKPCSFLNLPAELRLQVYSKVAADEDPALQLQDLLRVCKLIHNEVSNELPRLITEWLPNMEKELNKLFEGLQQRPNVPISCRVRVLGPVTKEEVDKVTISLPLSVFAADTIYEHPDLTAFALNLSLEGVLESLQRRRLAINLVNDTNARMPPTLSRPLVQSTCLCIDESTSSQDGRGPWTPCLIGPVLG
jgi:hypothetical protein